MSNVEDGVFQIPIDLRIPQVQCRLHQNQKQRKSSFGSHFQSLRFLIADHLAVADRDETQSWQMVEAVFTQLRDARSHALAGHFEESMAAYDKAVLTALPVIQALTLTSVLFSWHCVKYSVNHELAEQVQVFLKFLVRRIRDPRSSQLWSTTQALLTNNANVRHDVQAYRTAVIEALYVRFAWPAATVLLLRLDALLMDEDFPSLTTSYSTRELRNELSLLYDICAQTCGPYLKMPLAFTLGTVQCYSFEYSQAKSLFRDCLDCCPDEAPEDLRWKASISIRLAHTASSLEQFNEANAYENRVRQTLDQLPQDGHPETVMIARDAEEARGLIDAAMETAKPQSSYELRQIVMPFLLIGYDPLTQRRHIDART